jgi:hypothetical protein
VSDVEVLVDSKRKKKRKNVDFLKWNLWMTEKKRKKENVVGPDMEVVDH